MRAQDILSFRSATYHSHLYAIEDSSIRMPKMMRKTKKKKKRSRITIISIFSNITQ